MLKLTYSRKSSQYRTVTVLGDLEGIRDLYWQLTHNYKAQDGTEIANVTATNLIGECCMKWLITEPYVNLATWTKLQQSAILLSDLD